MDRSEPALKSMRAALSGSPPVLCRHLLSIQGSRLTPRASSDPSDSHSKPEDVTRFHRQPVHGANALVAHHDRSPTTADLLSGPHAQRRAPGNQRGRRIWLLLTKSHHRHLGPQRRSDRSPARPFALALPSPTKRMTGAMCWPSSLTASWTRCGSHPSRATTPAGPIPSLVRCRSAAATIHCDAINVALACHLGTSAASSYRRPTTPPWSASIKRSAFAIEGRGFLARIGTGTRELSQGNEAQASSRSSCSACSQSFVSSPGVEPRRSKIS